MSVPPNPPRKSPTRPSRRKEVAEALRVSQHRRSSIKESVGSFLEDCEEEDLYLETTRKKKDHLSTRSEHVSSSTRRSSLHQEERRSSLQKEELGLSGSEHSKRRIKRSVSHNAAGLGKPNRRASSAFDGKPRRRVSDQDNTARTRPAQHARRGSQSEHVSQSRKAPYIDSAQTGDDSDSSSASFCNDVEEEPQHTRRPRRTSSSGRKPPARAMSMTSGIEEKTNCMVAERDNRRASIKDQYRVNDVASISGGRSTMGGTPLSGASTHRRKIGSGLDGGPFNGFLNSSDDIPDKPSREITESFRGRRASTIEVILSEAKTQKWERESKERPEQEMRVHNDFEDMLGQGSDDDDDDQPRMKGKKKEKGLKQIANLVLITAKLSRSTVKGSVNAVRDPKRAAKNIGHFTKDAAKGTVNVVRDPKKAAMNVTNLTTKTIKGTVKIGANVTKDVAKGGFKVTRTVAKGSLGATTMVVGRTTDGLGKVVHGATGLIIKREKGELGQGHAEYHAKDLACRRKASMSLMDRMTEVVDTSDEALVAPAKKRPNNPSSRTASSSLLVPALIMSSRPTVA